MPFSKYFQDDPPPAEHQRNSGIQFQLPAFIHTGPPTLAPGGGAEVLTFNSAWFANNNSSSNGYYSAAPPHPPICTSICAPSPLGLPVYSASGFDVLSVLARVASRPNPRVVLGPVDMTCSFVVVDIRRHDQPIVYCSPTFCRLTGYPEHEVLGRNCRFLQAPPNSGPVRAGELRRFTSQNSVDTMRKALLANKEVQTSIVNFRKDGTAFINLVSVIPILGGERGAKHELNDVVYHVGFQVDLTEQPNAILDKLRDGSYTQNSLPLGPAAPPSNQTQHDLPPPPAPQRKQQLPPIQMAPSLSDALTNPALHRDLPITTSTTAPSPLPPVSASSASSAAVPNTSTNNPLSLILLEYAPDFILVVSLKGAFLYVAPAVSHVLGHPPSALVGRSISDLAHPEDVVPLERQLKESSTLVPAPPSPSSTSNNKDSQQQPQHARLIDVLFRARTAGGSYVWVEARGRLHVEPGKGRKAIVLSARARRMPKVRWGDLLPPLRVSNDDEATGTFECWAQLSGIGAAAGAIVSVGNGVQRVLGYAVEEVLGRRICALVVNEDREKVEGVLRGLEGERRTRVVVFVRVRMGKAEKGQVERVRLVFYSTRRDENEESGLGIAPPVVVLHLARGEGIDDLGHGEELQEQLHDPEENVFAELEVRRGSSWQYELQQLRFQNLRLREEVRVLEKEVKAHEGREVPLVEASPPEVESVAMGESTTLTVETTAAAGNAYPPPHYASPETNVGVVNSAVEQEPYRYDAHEQQAQQTHANYTAALDRYTANGTTYDQLEMALGMGMGMEMGVGMEMGMSMNTVGGMGMDTSASSSYALQQQQQQQHHAEHRSAFHQGHHSQLAQTQTQNMMYAPQPVHSSSGLLHALGPPSHHHSHSHLNSKSHHQQQPQQQQQVQSRSRPPMVRTYDPRTESHHHQQRMQVNRRRGEWDLMHPGVKRSYGGR